MDAYSKRLFNVAIKGILAIGGMAAQIQLK
jgi:hypothetical protein